MSRVTQADLHRLVAHANAILFWRGVADKETGIGRVQVASWGTPRRWQVQQVGNVGGGVRTLHPLSTAREAYAFLSGYIVSLRYVHPDAPLAGVTEGGQP